MTARVAPSDEFIDLMCHLVENRISAQQIDRLDALLCAAPTSSRDYVDFMLTVKGFRWIGASQTEESDGRIAEGQTPDSTAVRVMDSGLQVHASQPLTAIPPIKSSDVGPTTAPPTFLGAAFHSTAGYFSSGWPVAYLLAAVIFGIGLLIGAVVHVSDAVQVARELPPVTKDKVGPEPKIEFVGRITGMANCKFEGGSGFRIQGSGAENQELEIRNQKSLVALGDKFALSSGLLEITYDTGAKVILQGPVTYEVESLAGGYLSVGKLLARLKNKAEQSPNPKSQISKFVVRTPTATVTDLGTEFGVDVSDGASEIHVLKGLVRTQSRDETGGGSQPTQLREGEARRYRPASNSTDYSELAQAKKISFDWAKFEPLRIPRREDRYQRWLAYSQKLRKDPALVAYYTFESAGATNAILPNVSAAGSVLDGRVDSPEWVYGRLPGKFALMFRGPGSGDKVVLPEQQRFNFTGPFSAAVWFKVQRFTAGWQALVAKGDNSWRIQRFEKESSLTFDTNHGPTLLPQDVDPAISPTNVADARWHLAAAVYEPAGKVAHKRLYLDARLDAEGNVPLPLHQSDSPVFLGTNDPSGRIHHEFDGFIDEVAIFARALSPAEVVEMFQAGSPTSTATARGGSEPR